MNHYWLSDDDFKTIYSQVPRLTVDVLVSTPQGVILTWRDIPPAAGRWNIPGGTVYFNESLEEAARRIALEELNLKLVNLFQLDVIEYLHEEDKLGFLRHSVCIVMKSHFTDRVWETNFRETDTRRIFSRIPEPIHPLQRKLIEKVLASSLQK